MEGLLASFDLPNKHLLQGGPIELVLSPGRSHLRCEGIQTAAHTSGDASKDEVFDVVHSVVGEEVEMLRDDEVRGLILCPHQHGSHVVALRPPRLLPYSESMLVLPLDRRWAY